MPRIRSHNVEK